MSSSVRAAPRRRWSAAAVGVLGVVTSLTVALLPGEPPAEAGTTAPAGTTLAGSSGRPSGTAGAPAVGSAGYPVPVGALVVAPTGDDRAAGTAAAPLRTLGRAVAVAPAGGAVVLRAGSYTESVTVPAGKQLTVQNWPGEEVWLDGSRVVTGWVRDGNAWRVDGWTTRFDASPTYTQGAPDNRTADWSFVNPRYPLAAHPDQVFVDGAALVQVGSRRAVVPGTFFADYAARRLWIGTAPAGHQVRASTLTTGLTVRGAGSVVRGIGVRRYGTPVPMKGALLVLAPDVTVQDVAVSDNATQGMYVGGQGAVAGVRATLRHVTLERNGMLGLESSYADGLVLDGVLARGNNTQHFNSTPVAGGAKLTSARGITVTRSLFTGNEGDGLWLDESVYDATVTGNDSTGNTLHGVVVEISSDVLLADNLITGNGGDGFKLDDASDMVVWGNTLAGNAGHPVWLVQDSRRASSTSTPGHDPRQPLPDPTVTWLLGPVTFSDNVLAGPTTAACLLCVQDTALRRTAAQIGVAADGTVYGRTAAGKPAWTATWPGGTSGTQVYATIAAFSTATGQEPHGIEFTGVPVVDATGRLTPDVAAITTLVAQPLPDDLAATLGRTSGEQHVGAWFG